MIFNWYVEILASYNFLECSLRVSSEVQITVVVLFLTIMLHIYVNVTVSAKTSLVRTKFKFIFWPSLYVAILNSYPYTMSPVARLRWSAFLRGGFTAL